MQEPLPDCRFGAPRFNRVAVVLGGGISRQAVRMQYMI
jgi:hypothetical protein